MEKMKRIKRKVLLFSLLFLLIASGFGYRYYYKSVPNIVYLEKQEKIDKAFLPGVVYHKSMEASASGNYQVTCKLFGVIPLKTVKIEVVEPTWVIAGGESIGIFMHTQGVLVVNLGEIKSVSGEMLSPAKNILKAGDYIQKMNKEAISSKKEFIQKISECQGEDIELLVNREGEQISLRVHPVLAEDNSYKLGIWVRDDIQGIGTLTYRKDNGEFGALGHGINDIDTGTLLAIQEGALYETQIVSVVKGDSGNPGELSGIIYYSEESKLGDITQNTELGIYGTIKKQESFGQRRYQVGWKQNVQKGDASILSCVDGEVKEYSAVIEEIEYDNPDGNKNFVIKITDPRLLEYTGGIVQGMSGSPIIQNGKLIGAVTHVFIQDSTSGYGIFIENMISKPN